MRFTADLELFAAKQGGRKTAFRSGNWLNFSFGLTNEAGEVIQNGAKVELKGGDWIKPGEVGQAILTPLSPEALGGLIRPGLEFEIVDGPRVVGKGTVLDRA